MERLTPRPVSAFSRKGARHDSIVLFFRRSLHRGSGPWHSRLRWRTQGAAQKLTDADSGKTVKVKVGDSVTISLKGNPTTGYSWRTAKLDGQSIEQSGDPKYTVDAHQSGMVGVGGKFVFSFKATKSGKTQISLEYVRPWEKGKKPVQTFAVTIEVEVEDRAK